MEPSLIAILEGTVEDGCAPEEIAELRINSVEIGNALQSLGHKTEVVVLSLDVDSARRHLEKLKPAAVFNLVDSVEGKGDLGTIAQLLLEHLNLPFTGAGSMANAVTGHKVTAKQILRGAGLPTADWITQAEIATKSRKINTPYILKSVTEHASFGIFADSIASDIEKLHARWLMNRDEYWGDWFAEEFIDGREFNVSVLGTSCGPRVLPCAELTFTGDFPKDAPKIVDYNAKWLTDTAEYKGTVRSFERQPGDDALLKELERISAACWETFALAGYARVDFRVDKNNQPYVIDVNVNPFLTATEGFGFTAKRAGIAFPQLIEMIVEDAMSRGPVLKREAA